MAISSFKAKSTAAVGDQITRLVAQAGQIILGQDENLKLALTCLVAGGHLLLEDLPGVGKTTLAHTLARLSGLEFQRLQFTSDLLPADIVGTSIYHRERHAFELHQGPVFTQVLLADEVNRATPRAQSALLEAMEEQQVSIEGKTHPLPRPFFVIATQNPRDQIGTYPLPESQLDRFLMRLSLGYPAPSAERELLRGQDRRSLLATLDPVLDAATLCQLQAQVDTVHVAEPLLDYVQALLKYSRHDVEFVQGLSPRAGMGLLRAARAWALVNGRGHVVPEDVQRVLPKVVTHRLQALDLAVPVSRLVTRLLEAVAIP
ncbi:MAG: MoxR family ATPase [Gammaproteobacteria bacterium]|nr:MoxR family ATPase [Gammaproteobacteria bacterium]